MDDWREREFQFLKIGAEHISNVTYTHPNDDGSVSQEPELATAGAQAGGGSRGRDRDMQSALGRVAAGMATQFAGDVPKVGRNDPCPCGSGKKYKKCHMPADEHVESGS
jgi:preprotein translocase subunit SecA